MSIFEFDKLNEVDEIDEQDIADESEQELDRLRAEIEEWQEVAETLRVKIVRLEAAETLRIEEEHKVESVRIEAERVKQLCLIPKHNRFNAEAYTDDQLTRMQAYCDGAGHEEGDRVVNSPIGTMTVKLYHQLEDMTDKEFHKVINGGN